MLVFDRSPEILDVTLRDGSYLIDFQFTAEDTSKIATALEVVGIRWIEVGHGLGLNASKSRKGQAAASDEEYLEAAAGALKRAKWGMFCIPGIARLKDLDLAARYKMPFVRVGTNITEIERVRAYIERAKELGFIVSYNAMKSYAVSPTEFAICTAKVSSWGADIVCLVDSAGGMFPHDVMSYLDAAKSESNVYLGYHGHNNLSLAMANTLQAIECGADIIDSSLLGMGRSAGNAATEPLVAILKQRGHITDIDLNGVMDIGQGLIGPLMQGHGLDPMSITCGYALFHSSFSSKVKYYADRFNLDARDVIVQLTQEDLVDAPDDLLERISQDLAKSRIPRVISIPAFQGAKLKIKDPVEHLEMLLTKDLRPKAVKAKKFSTLNIVMGEEPMKEMRVSENIQNTPAHVVGSVTLTSEEQLIEALKLADGRVDVILLDVDRKPFTAKAPARTARKILKKSNMLTYFDSRVWINAVEDQAVRLMGEDLYNQVVVIIGHHTKSRFLALRLAERLAEVILLGEKDQGLSHEIIDKLSMASSNLRITSLPIDDSRAATWLVKAKILVAWTLPAFSCGPEMFSRINEGTLILDAGMGSLTLEAVIKARERGANLVRLNIWPALSGALESAHESDRVKREDLGQAEINGVAVVAGGAVGDVGDVVIDSINHPTRVIGLADGHGGMIFEIDGEDAERVRRVKEAIYRIQIAPRF